VPTSTRLVISTFANRPVQLIGISRNDLRGPYLGNDGFIYWSKGPALQEYLVDDKPWSSSARHIMRRHPNEKNAEPLMVGGMDNPIEIAFTLGGQRMITCTYALQNNKSPVSLSAGVR
jgi:hypothetical protein